MGSGTALAAACQRKAALFTAWVPPTAAGRACLHGHRWCWSRQAAHLVACAGQPCCRCAGRLCVGRVGRRTAPPAGCAAARGWQRGGTRGSAQGHALLWRAAGALGHGVLLLGVTAAGIPGGYRLARTMGGCTCDGSRCYCFLLHPLVHAWSRCCAWRAWPAHGTRTAPCCLSASSWRASSCSAAWRGVPAS